jgi:Flp pilus assembly protein TadG
MVSALSDTLRRRAVVIALIKSVGACCAQVAGAVAAGAVRSRWGVAAFRSDDRGTTAVMFALMTVVVIALVGGAVDFGRAVLAREKLQTSVDSAVLAAARIWQTEQDMTLAEQKAIIHFNSMKPEGVDAKLTKLTPDTEQNTLTIEAEATVTTPFLSIVRDEPLKISTRAQAKFCIGCRGGGGGGNDGYSIEVAMMLDTTGSMAGQRIADLKAAAKDLVNILVWSDQSEHSSRIAIVPFSHAVNAGTVLGPHVAYAPSSSLTFKFRDGKNRTWYRTNAYCVSERQGSNAYTDATPTGSNRLPRVYYGSSSNSNCRPAASVIPLTADKAKLTSTIDSFKAEGFTAGNLGTAWAWYMLSPTWWSGIPSDVHASDRPAAYPALPSVCQSWEKCPASSRGPGDVRKFAVLMTDGEYNQQFCNGSTTNTTGASIPDRNAGPGNSEKADCSSPLGSSSSQTEALCTAMKKAGIIVYTVGFGLGSSGAQVTLLKNCASEDGHFSNPGKLFYNTQTGTELRSAFRHIATSIASLYVSQ